MAAPRSEPVGRSRAARALRDPRVVAAAAAVAVRAAVAVQEFARHAAAPLLDSQYYLAWASAIAKGDLLGRGEPVRGEPFLFNPLYAYVVAPLTAPFRDAAPAALFHDATTAVVVFQTLLAGATAALAAAAARRFAGRAAAWTAGLATAFSAALVHLDGKVVVSGLAAFLTAGAVWALSPEEDGAAPRRGHGPLAAGAWIGLSLLARPVALFALPFAAWLAARRAPRRAAAVALFALPVALCAGLSFARNELVSGEPVLFTAADGLNLHLGNGPAARRTGGMASDEFRFGPLSMHDSARYRVAYEIRRKPTRSETSAWFRREALHDIAEEPGASLSWCARKLRWFASPSELASSYAFAEDVERVPLLRLAFLPTWILVALAAAALVAADAKRIDLFLGPAALVAAHAAACTIVYPLSHYRSPAVPALAVMAGVTVAAALRRPRGVRLAAALALAAGVAVAGALPPQGGDLSPASRLTEQAREAERQDRSADADDLARRALALDPKDVDALTVRVVIANFEARYDDAREYAAAIVALRPWDPDGLLDAALADARLGRFTDARREADEAVALYPWAVPIRGWRGAVRVLADDVKGGREDLEYAIANGFDAPDWARAKAGL
jgi:4-amino-4-deoxy-L-arabinose transferase-like glycosyltransferase